MKFPTSRGLALAAALALATLAGPPADAQQNPCAEKPQNPCNPCAANPCAGKPNPCNPCGANPCNPCGGAAIDPKRFQQPRGARLASGSQSELTRRGEQLWNDEGLGKTGLACASCHTNRYGLMKPSFDQAYPHYVEMPSQRAGVSQVSAAEMVQFCMIVPMADDPLPWNSQELAALTAYVEKIQAGFDPSAAGAAAANPCNPCAAKANPCNPCAGRP